jgi:hypothetical protein
VLRVADLSGTALFAPGITLYNPSSIFVTFGQGQNGGSIAIQALATGTYTVVVADGSTKRDGVGNYNLYFVRAPGANEGGRFFDGVTPFDTIDLGDLDSYAFTANPGRTAQITVTDTSGLTFTPVVTLHGPGGAFITFT